MGDFIFITESVKGGISESSFYHFFDNATVGAFFGTLFAIGLGSFVAGWQYRTQKEIDRFELKKDRIIDKLILLDEKVASIGISTDKILENVLNVGSLVNFYFHGKNDMHKLVKELDDVITNWCDFIDNYSNSSRDEFQKIWKKKYLKISYVIEKMIEEIEKLEREKENLLEKISIYKIFKK